MILRKIQYAMPISEEMRYDMMAQKDPRYERKFCKIEALPTPEDFEDYRKAQEALEVLKNYEWTEWGGPDYGTEVLPPSPRVTYEFLETAEEWLARCRAMSQE